MKTSPRSPAVSASLQAFLAALAATLLAAGSHAQTTWSTAPSNGQATNDANWAGGVAPADGAAWVFANSSIVAVTNGFAGYTIGGLSFATNAGGYAISGNAFTLAGGITNESLSSVSATAPFTINGATTIANGSGRVSLNGAIGGGGSIVKNGTGTLSIGVTNTFSGGVTLNDGAIRPGANSAVSSGTVTGGAFGAGNLTINGGRIMPGGAGGLYQPLFLVNSNFAVNAGFFTNADNGRLSIAGLIDLAGGTRAVTLGRWTNAAGSLAGGQESLRFFSNNLLAATVTNGTMRLLIDPAAGAADYVSVNFAAGSVFAAGSGVAVGSNVITTMATGNPFDTAGSRPQVSVEAGGYFNMSDASNSRSPVIRTLAGAGIVTSLGNATSPVTSTLTISNGNAADNAVFTGQIVTGSALNASLGTSATNIAIALVKHGPGTQTLAGSNSYTGTTTITEGTLRVGSGGTIGNLGSGNIANNGTLIFNRSDNIAQGTDFSANAISGSGRLVQAGSGTVTLSTNNTATGGAAIEAGAISISVSDNRLGAAPGAFTPDALTLSGGGKLVVSGTNSFTLSANRGITLGSGGGAIEIGPDQTTINPAGQIISGTGSLTKLGDGTLSLTASNTFSGGFVLNGGSIRLLAAPAASGGVLSSSSVGVGDVTINGGTIFGANILTATNIHIGGNFAVNEGTNIFNGRVGLNGNINLGGAARTVSLGRFMTAASALQTDGNGPSLRFATNGGFTTTITNGSMRFVRASTGTSADYVGLNFNTTNTWAGGTGFTIGTNVITTFNGSGYFTGSGTNLPVVTLEAGGIFNLGTTNGVNSQTIRALSGSSGYVTTLATMASNATATLTISNEVGDYHTFGGQIVTGSTLNSLLGTTATNAGFALTKTGAGTQVLNGANAYTGNTTINNGLLELGPAGSLTFNIGASGVNNAVTGSGSALFRGTFIFDLASAATNIGDSWTIVASGTTKTYDGGFSVAGFTNSGGVWFRGTNGVFYLFAQSNSVLSVAAAPPPPSNPYTSWLTNYPSLSGTNALPAADPDADGFSNQEEFAFGGDPTIGSPALLRASKTGTNVNMSFIADTNALTYVVRGRTNLAAGSWTNAAVTISNAPDQSGVLLTNYVRRQFTVPAAGAGFYEVQGVQAP